MKLQQGEKPVGVRSTESGVCWMLMLLIVLLRKDRNLSLKDGKPRRIGKQSIQGTGNRIGKRKINKRMRPEGQNKNNKMKS